MFQNLYQVYNKLKRPSSLFFLNSWSYSSTNVWLFLSNELLSYYISSIRGFKSVTQITSHIQPYLLYKILIISIFILQLGIILG